MRRAHHVGQAEQRVRGRRLVDEHVECRACHLPRLERLGQRRLVHQAAARAIDDAHALFHLLDGRGIDDVLGLFGKRGVQRDEIGPLEQRVELDLLDTEIARALLRQERIVGDHLHLQADGAVGDDRTDIAAADDAERLAENLHAHEFVLFPFAGARRGVGFRNLAGQRQHQRDRVLGGGDRIAERRVHHDDAARGGRRDVDIVDADAGAADHLQVFCLFEDLGRHLGGRADGEAVETADQFGKLVLILTETGLEIDLDAAILEDLHGGGRKRIGDENFGHGDCCFF